MPLPKSFFLSTILLAGFQLSLIRSASAAAPVIQSALNAANFKPGIASAAWIAISGSNLSTSTRAWENGDFSGGNLPVSLDGVQVTINGKSAYVYFVSPGQVNVLAPDDPTVGTVSVQLTNSLGTSNAYSASKQAVSPALFAYSQLGGHFAVVQTAVNYGLVAPPGLLGRAVTTKTTSPGSSIVLYGTGLGPVAPAQPTGQLVQAAAPTTNPVTVTIGGQPAPVSFAGLIGAGLYQINVTVPPLLSGDAPIVVSVAGKQSGGDASIPVQAYGPVSGQSAPTLAGCVKGQVDYLTYNTALLSYGQTVETSIGGTQLCPTCNVKSPIYPEFTSRLALALERKKTLQACYDSSGVIFQLRLFP